MGHRRLASVRARPAVCEDRAVVLRWRDNTSVEIDRLEADVAAPEATLPALAAALRRAHAHGAVYAVARVIASDVAAIRCLLRAGFEPELAGPGHEAAWERLLAHESRSSGVL